MFERIMRRLGYEKIRPLPKKYLHVRGVSVTVRDPEVLTSCIIGPEASVVFETLPLESANIPPDLMEQVAEIDFAPRGLAAPPANEPCYVRITANVSEQCPKA